MHRDPEQFTHSPLLRLDACTHLSHKGFVGTRRVGIVLALKELIIYLWTLIESTQRQIKIFFTKVQDITRPGSDDKTSTNNNFFKDFCKHPRDRVLEGSGCILEKRLGLSRCVHLCAGGGSYPGHCTETTVPDKLACKRQVCLRDSLCWTREIRRFEKGCKSSWLPFCKTFYTFP